MPQKNKIFLVLIFFFFAALNIFIILKNKTPLVYDESTYFSISYDIHNLIKDFFRIDFATAVDNMISFYHLRQALPLLFPASISFAHFIPGFNQYTFPIVNIFYLGFLVFAVYKLGSILKDSEAGLLAAFITLTSPSIFAFSRTLFMELPLAAIVVLNFYFIIKARQDPTLKNFIFLGLATSFGMLCKYSFLIYTFIPIGALLAFSPGKKRLANISVFLLLVLLITSPYYLIPFLDKTLFGSTINYYIHRTYGSFLTFQYYPKKLFIHIQSLRQKQIGSFYFILFIISLAYFLFKNRKNITPFIKLTVLSWLIVPYFIIIAISFGTKDILIACGRHMLPIVPAIALLISLFVTDLKSRRARQVIYSAIIIFAIAQFVCISFKNFLRPQDTDIPPEEIYIERFHFGLLSPYTVNFQQESIFKSIEKSGPVIIIPDTPLPELITSLEVENTLNGYPVDLLSRQFHNKKTQKEASRAIRRAFRYSSCIMVIRSHKIDPTNGIFASYNPNTYNFLKKMFEKNIQKFGLRKIFTLSDKDVFIYVKTNKKIINFFRNPDPYLYKYLKAPLYALL